jgi:hypothetical protein
MTVTDILEERAAPTYLFFPLFFAKKSGWLSAKSDPENTANGL